MFENQWEVIKYIEDKFENKLSYVSAPYQNANLPYSKDIDTGIEFIYIYYLYLYIKSSELIITDRIGGTLTK
ncbi:Uncharacterised protein [uncultured Prevotella sp.]|nr:Uncharacterised protein [uncultured Prevotella sp.]